MSSARLAWIGRFFAGAMAAALAGWLIYQLPPVKYRLEWRLDAAYSIMLGWIHPGDTVPTPAGAALEPLPTAFDPSPTPTPAVTESADTTPEPTPTPIPGAVSLSAPDWEKQDWNNCGPATLAMALRYFGWTGDQFDISDLLKPDRGDKNVNVEELVYYVRTRAGWLSADYRVGGTIETLKRFVAAGFPVMIEEGFILAEGDGGGGWAGHYLLLTGYDDQQQAFIAQDSNPATGGANRVVMYDALDNGWHAFNRVFIYLYPPDQQSRIDDLLGDDADADANRQRALDTAQAEVDRNPSDAYAWFNLGSNLVYFERYGQASAAFDNALKIGLPWRFTRYQFGPYIAYFNRGRLQDVIDLATATLYRTYKSEEAMLWRGWAYYRLGNVAAAREDFLGALKVNPNYLDARYALQFINSPP
jgi:tetratricopeptide (TPR) repeat protein